MRGHIEKPSVELVVLVLGLVLVGGLVDVGARYLDLPVVHRSWTTKQCVRVEDPAAEARRRPPATCDRIPEAHETVWVE